MAVFNNMVITDAGKLLYAEAQGGTPIVFTRMQIGSGQIGIQDPTSLLALITPTNYIAISGIVTDTVNKQAIISSIINNSAMTVTTYACEIGLWAGDILYGYASAGTEGDYMAPASQGAYSWAYQVNAAIGDAADVTATISNLEYDYNIISTNVLFQTIANGTQKDINESIDNTLTTHSSEISNNSETLTVQGNEIGTINTALTTQGNEIVAIDNTLTTQGNEIKTITDYTIRQSQDTGGLLNGYIQTKQGFMSQWGRFSVPPGAGVTVPLAISVTIISGINTNCTTGMHLTYTPKTSYTHAAPITSFTVSTDSTLTEEIFWRAEGRV